MRNFKLRGIAEGVVGSASVQASSIEDLFRRYPQLASIRSKLRIRGKTVYGFAACDG